MSATPSLVSDRQSRCAHSMFRDHCRRAIPVQIASLLCAGVFFGKNIQGVSVRATRNPEKQSAGRAHLRFQFANAQMMRQGRHVGVPRIMTVQPNCFDSFQESPTRESISRIPYETAADGNKTLDRCSGLWTARAMEGPTRPQPLFTFRPSTPDSANVSSPPASW
jgi:hypothetical protein